MKLAQQRALMRRLWNIGEMSHADIAVDVGLSVDVVAEWLAKQPGYPGIIAGRMVQCRGCGADFEAWGPGRMMHCSQWCRTESRRQAFWRSMARRRGLPDENPPPRRQWRSDTPLSASDRQICKLAGEEARERGTTRKAVLAEWKFVPQRSAT